MVYTKAFNSSDQRKLLCHMVWARFSVVLQKKKVSIQNSKCMTKWHQALPIWRLITKLTPNRMALATLSLANLHVHFVTNQLTVPDMSSPTILRNSDQWSGSLRIPIHLLSVINSFGITVYLGPKKSALGPDTSVSLRNL